MPNTPPVKQKNNFGLPDYSILKKPQKNYTFGYKDGGKDLAKRWAKILAILAILFSVYYYYFLYIDFSNGCMITIRPALLTWSNRDIKESLSVLKQKFPTEYYKVCQRIGTINPNFSCGGFGGGCFTPDKDFNPTKNDPNKKATIDVSTNPGNIANTLNVIVHETCHAYQFFEHRPLEQTECYKAGDAVSDQIDKSVSRKGYYY